MPENDCLYLLLKRESLVSQIHKAYTNLPGVADLISCADNTGGQSTVNTSQPEKKNVQERYQ